MTPEDPNDLPSIARLLDRLTGSTARVDDIARTASVPVTNRVADLVAVATGLHAETIQVSNLGIVRPSLDDVFLALTGTVSPNAEDRP